MMQKSEDYTSVTNTILSLYSPFLAFVNGEEEGLMGR